MNPVWCKLLVGPSLVTDSRTNCRVSSTWFWHDSSFDCLRYVIEDWIFWRKENSIELNYLWNSWYLWSFKNIRSFIHPWHLDLNLTIAICWEKPYGGINNFGIYNTRSIIQRNFNDYSALALSTLVFHISITIIRDNFLVVWKIKLWKIVAPLDNEVTILVFPRSAINCYLNQTIK